MNARKVRVGLYGVNAHQVHRELVNHPMAQVIAIAEMPEAQVPEAYRDVPRYKTLADMLAVSDIDLVSLCSPWRTDQAADAMNALRRGKHVFAEKPSALTDADLTRIIATSRETGRRFHEQALTAFQQPYCAMRKIVAAGTIGEVVQVYAQKSYPWHDARPQDERIDGGLLTQVGVYCARYVEHIAGVPIRSLVVRETMLGNPVASGQCRRAVSMLMELGNGGVASGVANYLCPAPPLWQNWGYETLRIWGTKGFVESIDMGHITSLVVEGRPCGPIDCSEAPVPLLDLFLREIQTGQDVVPFTLEQELSPTRWVVRAKERLRTGG